MLRRLLYRFSARLPCRLIYPDGRPYLERYYLGRLFGFTFYLHRFVNGDGDRALHDHPWRWCGALCLAGGYREQRLRWFDPERGFTARERRIRPGRLNLMNALSFHQILAAEPDTWTLFAHSGKVKEWGFLETRPGHDTDPPRLHYYRDRDPTSHRQWWQSAPRGADSPRAPLRLGRDRGHGV